MFKYASLTKNGMALIAQATNLKSFVFTRMEYGDGVPEGFDASKTSDEIKAILAEKTSLVSKKADIGMAKISVKNNCATLTGKIIASSLTEDFFARELGVYAKIDDGSDVLVAYFISDEAPDPINQAALVGQEHKIVVDVAVGNASNVTVVYSPDVYTTQEEFAEFIASSTEEHNQIKQLITDEENSRENADTALQQSITDEATARENADTALQQSITDLEASVDEKIGSIDISAALSHIKQYDFVVDSNETLLAWANCTDGSMKSVLVKSGEYTLDGKMINLVNAGTKFVFAEDGNKITVSNYFRGIGATEDYGAVIVGLNVEVSFTDIKEVCAFYRGMICYNCTGTGNGYEGGSYGFYNCTCYNCTGEGNGGYDDRGYGFYNCTCSNCTGTGEAGGDGSGYGFSDCTCSNCTGTGDSCGFSDCTCSNCTGTGDSYGFSNCTCSNCTGTGDGGCFDSGYGFYNCTCSNCTGTGTSESEGYGFYNCKYCSSCRAGDTASTTATWGGTNTYIDSDSCDYVAA